MTPHEVAERDVFDLSRIIKVLEETPPEYLAARLSDLESNQVRLSRLLMVLRNRRAA